MTTTENWFNSLKCLAQAKMYFQKTYSIFNWRFYLRFVR